MSALRKAIMPKVQTIEIPVKLQKSRDAAVVTVLAQPLAAAWYRVRTVSRTSTLSTSAWAVTANVISHNARNP